MIGDIFNLLLLQPTINLITIILYTLESLHIPSALGWSIILLTVLVKLVLWPFTDKQIKHARDMQQKMAELKPKLDTLKKKHKGDQLALTRAQNELYKEAGINPAGGCLPSLVPILVLLPLYQVIGAYLGDPAGLERINYFLYPFLPKLDQLPDPHFLGINLAAKPQDFLTAGVSLVFIPIFTALLQFILSKMMIPQPVKPNPQDKPKEVSDKIETDEAIAQMQSSMVYYMPVVFGFIAFTFPVGLSLYIITLNIVSIYQQYLIAGWGGLEGWVKKINPSGALRA